MKNKKILIIEFILIIMFLTTFISAFGVVTNYWEEYPLNIYYGETKIVNLNAQNMVYKNDVSFTLEVTEGQDIASLEGDTFTVKQGTHDMIIPLSVSIPEDYAQSVQKIKIKVRTIASGDTQGIELSTGMTLNFDAVITEKPKETPKLGTLIWIILLILIIIVVIVAIILNLLLKRK